MANIGRFSWINAINVLAGEKKIIIEKPRVLHRVFFSIQAFADQTAWYESKISFDDPQFCSFYALDGPARYFEAKGEGIFQGDIWAQNVSTANLLFVMTEILV